MPIQKIKAGRIITVPVNNYVGEKGTIFYDEDVAELRLSNGTTPGGILFGGGGGSYVLPPATTSTLGGIIVGNNLTITPSGVLSVTNFSTNIDGGRPDSVYGGIPSIDCGGVV